MHFEFEHPYWFVLLLPIVCIYLCPIKATKRYFVHLHLFDVSKGMLDKEKLLVMLSLVLMVLTLASPIVYEQKSPNKKKGRDLVIVLDSSGSMSESDFANEEPDKSKFDAVREILADFITHRGDDNIGVVLFGTFAFATAPLTYDMNALKFMLRYIEPGLAGENTAIGDGLHEALSMLHKGSAKEKVIVLLSDGYQNSGSFSIKNEVHNAVQDGVKIYTIGIGERSDYDVKLLERIAKESGGKFFTAKDKKQLQSVYESIEELEPSPIRSQHYLNKTNLFDLPLLGALVVLFSLLLKRKRMLV